MIPVGGSDGPLAREYVLAHKFGHAIQHQLGILDHDHSQTGATSDSVRTELQADCFADMWAKAASSTVDPDTGVVFLQRLTEQDINDAITAASPHSTDDRRVPWSLYTAPPHSTDGIPRFRRAQSVD